MHDDDGDGDDDCHKRGTLILNYEKKLASVKNHKKFTTSFKRTFIAKKNGRHFSPKNLFSIPFFCTIYFFQNYILLPIVKSLRRRWQNEKKTHADNRSLEGGNSAIAVVQFDMAFGLDIH